MTVAAHYGGPVACCYAALHALSLMLLRRHHGALLIVLPAFPTVLTVMLYSLLSGHFAAVMLRCCHHAALLLCMLLTTVHVACHCPATLLLLYSLASSTDCQFYALVSPSHCLPPFDYFATFRLPWWCHTALPVSYGLTTVMPVCHACCSPAVILPC